jgi:glycogen phosphorylase
MKTYFCLDSLPGRCTTPEAGRSPYWHYQNEPEAREADRLIASGRFNPGEPGGFAPILDVLLARGKFHLRLADLFSYAQTHNRLARSYSDPEAWARAAILNVASSGKFSSDRTIAEYALRFGMWRRAR